MARDNATKKAPTPTVEKGSAGSVQASTAMVTMGGAPPAKAKRPGKAIELGVTGTQVLGGLILADPNVELQFPRSVTLYDKMRRTDGQVKAALLAISLPILSLDWDIEPHRDSVEEGGDMKEPTPENKEIAQFVKTDLLEEMTTSWKATLRQILGMLWAGFWVVEPVFESREGKVHLRKLGSRLPSSIYRWKIARDGGLLGLIQRATNPENGQLEEIPINSEDLLVFTHEREGADWTGISVLRSAYKHWYMKDWLYRIGVINVERGGGFPVITMPEEPLDSDLMAARDVGESIHIHERAYVIEPPGWKFRLETGTSRIGDVMAQIAHHDQKISANILAQFMDLGSTETGSRALAGEFIDLFLMSEEAVISNIEDTINRHLIKKLVDYNWTVKGGYPKLKAQNIRGFNVRRMGAILRMLADGQMVIPDEPLETFLRKSMGLPEADPDTRRQKGGGMGGFGEQFGGGTQGLPPAGGNAWGGESSGGYGNGNGGGYGKPTPGGTAEPMDKGSNQTTAALSENHQFSSVMLPVPPSIAQEVTQWQAQIPDEVLIGKGLEPSPHITVKYGLNSTVPADVEAVLRGTPPIPVRLGRVIVFHNPGEDVLAVSVEGTGIEQARRKLSERLSWQDSHVAGYVPHMTLAFVRPGLGEQFAGDETFVGRTFTAGSVLFSSKLGSTHTLPLTDVFRPVRQLREGTFDLLDQPFFYTRPLTDVERSCNFTEIDKAQKQTTRDLLSKIQPIQEEQIKAIVRVLGDGPGTAKSLYAITQLRIPYVGRMAAVLQAPLQKMFETGREQVRQELRRQADAKHQSNQSYQFDEPLDPTKKPEDAFDYLTAKAEVLSERWANKLKEVALSAKLQLTRSPEAPPVEPQQTRRPSTLTGILTSLLGAASLGLFFSGVTEAFSLGRQVEAEAQQQRATQAPPPGEPGVPVGPPLAGPIQMVQYSAILDRNTCSVCRSLDGTVAPITDPRMQTPNPNCIGERYLNACRCLVLYVL